MTCATKDYFPRNEERFMIVSALQMMSTVGMLLAPVLGGVSGKLGAVLSDAVFA
jgi:MFS family permease